MCVKNVYLRKLQSLAFYIKLYNLITDTIKKFSILGKLTADDYKVAFSNLKT